MGVLTGAKSSPSSVLWMTAFAASGLSALSEALRLGSQTLTPAGMLLVGVATPSLVIRFVNTSAVLLLLRSTML